MIIWEITHQWGGGHGYNVNIACKIRTQNLRTRRKKSKSNNNKEQKKKISTVFRFDQIKHKLFITDWSSKSKGRFCGEASL